MNLFCSALAIATALAAPAASNPKVGMVTREYADPQRQNWSGTGPRPLRTAIWYPIDTFATTETIFEGAPDQQVFVPYTVAPAASLSKKLERYPLVVLSHGTGGSLVMMMWLGTYLAERGYIVAAVNHHGNTAAETVKTPQGFLLYWERARDLSVAIDNVLRDPLFNERIDSARIGAAGFSLGGFTVIEVAGGRFNQRSFDDFCRSRRRDYTCEPQNEFPEAQAKLREIAETDPVVRESFKHSGDSYRDARVRSVFAIAPALGSGFSRGDLRHIDIPVEIVVGRGDTVTPPRTNALRFANLIRNANVTVLPGNVGHYTFLHECTTNGKEVLDICRDGDGVDRAAVHEVVAERAFRFFQRTLR